MYPPYEYPRRRSHRFGYHGDNCRNNADARLWVSGETLEGRDVNKTGRFFLPVLKPTADERLRSYGAGSDLIEGDLLTIDMVDFSSDAQDYGD